MTKLIDRPASESRRGFLKAGGALVVTFSVGGVNAAAPKSAAAAAKSVATNQVDGFLAIDAKGMVHVSEKPGVGLTLDWDAIENTTKLKI